MATADLSTKGEYFKAGKYTAEILKLEFRNGFKGLSFIAKFKVLESDNPEVEVGSTRTFIAKLDDPRTKPKVEAEIKAIIFALSGIEPDKVKSFTVDPKPHQQAFDLWKAAVSEESAKKLGIDSNWYEGRKVFVEVREEVSPKAREQAIAEAKVKGLPEDAIKPKTYAKHFWHPVTNS